jgi:hypothetical protein
MLTKAERNVLNIGLQKYRPGQSEPILVGGENLLKPTLRLMSDYRLEIEEIKDTEVVTSYTRWLECVQAKERKIRKFICRNFTTETISNLVSYVS